MRINQPTMYGCAAAVMAMITGAQVEDVFREIGHRCERKGMRFDEVVVFLAKRGYHLGAYAEPALPGSSRMIKMEWSRSIPAYLVVANRNGTGSHAVYWNGRQVLDPEPDNAGMGLDEYYVREWWPVITIQNTEAVQK